MPKVLDAALCKLAWAKARGLGLRLAQQRPSAVTGSCPPSPSPSGLAGKAGVGTSYGGGAAPKLMVDAGLRASGEASALPAFVGVP